MKNRRCNRRPGQCAVHPNDSLGQNLFRIQMRMPHEHIGAPSVRMQYQLPTVHSRVPLHLVSTTTSKCSCCGSARRRQGASVPGEDTASVPERSRWTNPHTGSVGGVSKRWLEQVVKEEVSKTTRVGGSASYTKCSHFEWHAVELSSSECV